MTPHSTMNLKRASSLTPDPASAFRPVIIALLFFHVFFWPGPLPGQAALPPEAVALNNDGVALMGQFDYEAAREIFFSLSEAYPDAPDIQVNLAIAVLNRQEDGDEATALDILRNVLKNHPENLRARFCTGLLELHGGRPDVGADHFRQVVEVDPSDVDAIYFLAQCYMQQSRPQDALPWFKKVLEKDPYLLSAYYGGFQANQRLKNRQEAREMLNHFKRLKNNPRARAIEFKYMKMGAKSEAASLDGAPEKMAPKPKGALFEKPRPLSTASSPGLSKAHVNLTYCDLNGDGRLDVFVAGGRDAAKGPGNAVLLSLPDGGYQPADDHPLTGIPHVNTALWGDYDNDGLTDVYLLVDGPNQLWRQAPQGQWQNVGESTGTANDLNTVDGAMSDADHDGDLDLFLVNANGPNELYNNNLDGTFRPLATEYGLAGSDGLSKAVLAADLDNDRDMDLLVINQKPPHQVFINHLVWEYQPGEGWDELLKSDLAAAVAADMDADGRLEIYTLDSAGGLTVWTRSREDIWQGSPIKWAESPVSGGLTGMALEDLDGDGRIDMMVWGDQGWLAAAMDTTGLKMIYDGRQDAPGGLQSAALMSTANGPVLGAWYADSLRLWPAGPGRFQFAQLSPTGREAPADAMRSNASGIGVRFAIRIDSHWRMVDSCRHHSGPGQSLQPATVGLAGASKIDFVAINWSDGVYQTERHLAAGRHQITETQRQLSSCPVLFAWDGEKFNFISDLLGVGGVGYFLAPGQYSESRPFEHYMLSSDQLQAKNGRFLIKLTEPMEELTYLDAVRLKAYDLPPGWSMTLDERMGITEPFPTAQPVFYRKMESLVQAVDADRQDVTEALRTSDGRASPIPPRDLRFIGLLTREQAITLTFAEPIDQTWGQPLLLADGWIEYPYSQTNFAAWQAGLAYQAPSLDAAGKDGRFRTVREQFGYPAGMPHQMTIPLPELPAGCRTLRIRTNQEIYWDRVTVVHAETCPGVRVHPLPLATARLEQIGFPERANGPQHLPGYRFANRRPDADMHIQEGLYTRIGPVRPLLATRDNAVAIFGPGEGVHLEFSSPAALLPAGWKRAFVLEVEGWCKDMDLYTKDGETVEPVPHFGEKSKQAMELNKKYNIRFRSGRL